MKKFACYSSEKDLVVSECVDRTPVSLAIDIFSGPKEILQMDGCCKVSHFLRKGKRNFIIQVYPLYKFSVLLLYVCIILPFLCRKGTVGTNTSR